MTKKFFYAEIPLIYIASQVGHCGSLSTEPSSTSLTIDVGKWSVALALYSTVSPIRNFYAQMPQSLSIALWRCFCFEKAFQRRFDDVSGALDLLIGQ